jgi:alginate O-acetyltransferase complex protein AlgI
MLLLWSALFYLWGSGYYIALLALSVVVNFSLGKFVEPTSHNRKRFFIAGLFFNLGLLWYFKYCNFTLDQLGALGSLLGVALPSFTPVILPIGISFFTFQSIAYLCEVYRGDHPPAKSLIDYALYITLFPHLIAGPIVRFSDIRLELMAREVTSSGFAEGIWRFSLGLGKKVVIANEVGAVADKIFSLPGGELSPAISWLGVLCYTMQIYYDFSGYSDMAIGLARMFGFTFPENFNQPYRSHNITEFWRRWHMSLSRWFRDFVYISLGGNRHGHLRTYLNLATVFLLCGFWHGAAWNYVLWGAYHGALLIFERVISEQFKVSMRGWIWRAYAFIAVMIGWVLFRSATLDEAGRMLSSMFALTSTDHFQYFHFFYYCSPQVLLLLLASFVFALLPIERWTVTSQTASREIMRGIISLLILSYSVVQLSKASFNPFIYFQF